MMQRKAIFVRGIAFCLLLALCVSVLSVDEVEAASKLKKPSFTVTKRTKTTATIKIKKMDKVTVYHVFMKKGKKGKYRLVKFSFTRTFKITKLKPGSEYYVKIRASRTRGLRIKKSKFSKVKKIKKYKKPSPKPTTEPSAQPSPDPSASPSDPATQDQYAQDVLALVNEERAKEGLSPLVLDQKLCEAAAIRANEIVEKFEHTRPDGTSCFTVLQQNGINYRTCGENIAVGQSTPAAVMDSWMDSEGHRANIMSSDFGKLGVGFVQAPGGYQYYWVQLFTD